MDGAYRVGMRRACRVVEIGRSTYYYRSVRDDRAIRQRIHVLLRREGWHVNHKRVYRIYCERGLNLRSKRPKRRVSAALREKEEAPRSTI